MLGHVAQSVGGALPRTGGGASFLGQFHLRNGEDRIVPEGALFAFVEVQAKGGSTVGTRGNASAGGAASDSIVAVRQGDVLRALIPYSTSAAEVASISLNGTILISANSPALSNAPTQAGPAGKYPGGPATANTAPGSGGGRLGGIAPTAEANWPPVGCGRVSTGAVAHGGAPAAFSSFFTTYDAALAFANSLYGGNWQP